MLSKTLIAIPVFNGQDFIERTLKSCLDQTLPTRIYVVDNCSTDNTRKIVKRFEKKYKKVKLFVNEKNLGRVGNWNRCLDLFEKSKYNYIKFIFVGDEIFPSCIEETEKVFAKDEKIGAVAFPSEFVNLKGGKAISRQNYKNKLFSIKEINRINLENGGLLGAIISNVYNKKFINGYRFSEYFMGKSDFDYEILSRSKAYYLNKVLARFNLDGHRTYAKALSHLFESEVVFNKSYRLEKMKKLFSQSEYDGMKEKILIDFVTRNFNYHKTGTFIRLSCILVLKLIKDLVRYDKIVSYAKKSKVLVRKVLYGK